MQPKHRNSGNDATTGIKVRPPLLFVFALLVGFTMDHLLPLPLSIPRESELVHQIIPGLSIFIGMLIFATGIRNFFRASTPVPSNRPVTALVTTGIHGWSRNPIYVGMLLLYIGIGIAVRSPWILILVLPVFIILRVAVVAREEAYLEQQFGDAYRDYKASVRRWL